MQVNQTPVRVVGVYPNAATRLLRGLLVLELPTPEAACAQATSAEPGRRYQGCRCAQVTVLRPSPSPEADLPAYQRPALRPPGPCPLLERQQFPVSPVSMGPSSQTRHLPMRWLRRDYLRPVADTALLFSLRSLSAYPQKTCKRVSRRRERGELAPQG